MASKNQFKTYSLPEIHDQNLHVMVFFRRKVMTYYQQIHEEAVRAARTYKKSEHALLIAIQKVDSKRVYQRMGYKNLYDYCVKCLLLSEGTTYAIIRVARKSLEIPEIQKAIGNGELNLSHAKAILTVIKPENKEEWISKAKTLSVRNLEKEVAKVNPQVVIREKLRPISQTQVKLECGIGTKTSDMMERAKELLCQKTGRAVNLEETLLAVFSDYLDRNDPLKKPSRLATWPQNPKTLTPAMKREVLKDYEGKCPAKDPKGNICGQSRWIDTHHIKLVSQGGTHERVNLIPLCKDHHRLWHLKGPDL
jgi:hypothetical protein